MKKYILFDLDGTLTDSAAGIINCVKYALQQLNMPVPDNSTLMKFLGPPLTDSFVNFCAMSPDKAQMAVEKYRDRFSTVGMYENKVYPGIEQMLTELKKAGKTLAIATSKPYVYATKIMDKYGLTKYFDVIAGSELDGTRSKKEEVIAYALNCLNLSQEDKPLCLMVGDRCYDAMGAQQAGLDFVAVGYGYAAEGELEQVKCAYLVENVEKLQKVLLSY